LEDDVEEDETDTSRAHGRKQQRRKVEIEAEESDQLAEAEEDEAEDEDAEPTPAVLSESEAEDRKRRRRRGRRGGKRRREGETEARAAEEKVPQPDGAREERAERSRNGRRRRRGRGRDRRVYEVDGGEWLDFVSADLKHLTPRPERSARNGDARRKQQVNDKTDEAEAPTIEEAEIIVHPAAEPLTESFGEMIGAAMEPEPALAPPVEQPAYEPDQERREKFFSRLSRWSKKS
jgi:ribonuclease E